MPRIAKADLLPRQVAVSTEQAALLLGVSRATLQRYIVAGEIPSTRLGRRRLMLVADLEAWLKALGKQQRGEVGRSPRSKPRGRREAPDMALRTGGEAAI